MIVPGDMVVSKRVNFNPWYPRLYGDVAFHTDAPATFEGLALVLAVMRNHLFEDVALIIVPSGVGYAPCFWALKV